MTAAGSIITGGRIVAAALRGAAPQAVIKAIDETEGVNGASPATLIADAALYLAVAASTTYLFGCYLDYDGQVHASGGDLEYQWTVPSGAALRYSSIGTATGGSAQVHATQQAATRYQLQTAGVGTLMAAVMLGTLVTGATAGTLQLTWSTYQDTGTHTTIHAQSFLALWQLSP